MNVMKKRTESPTSDDARQVFREYLGRHCIKHTAAREKILGAVLELHEHFEAEQVLYLLRERGDKVGKATVYRTLPLLVQAGILRQTRFDVKHVHYEYALGEAPHDHLVCRSCGRILEFRSRPLLELRRRIAERHRFTAHGHRFQISGICNECKAARSAVAAGGAP
jgi:Fur family ferric uptake transcriptional regulator